MDVQVSEFRRQLAYWLRLAEAGEAISIRSGTRVVARIGPALDERQSAEARLQQARRRARIGDILSPIEQEWDADR